MHSWDILGQVHDHESFLLRADPHLHWQGRGALSGHCFFRVAPLSTRRLPGSIFNSRCTICMRKCWIPGLDDDPFSVRSQGLKATMHCCRNLVSSSFLKSSFFPSFPIMINATFTAFYRKTADDGTSASIPHIFLGLCLGSTLRCREHSVMNRLRRGTWVVVLLAPVVPVQSFLSCQGWYGKLDSCGKKITFFLALQIGWAEYCWRRLTPWFMLRSIWKVMYVVQTNIMYFWGAPSEASGCCAVLPNCQPFASTCYNWPIPFVHGPVPSHAWNLFERLISLTFTLNHWSHFPKLLLEFLETINPDTRWCDCAEGLRRVLEAVFEKSPAAEWQLGWKVTKGWSNFATEAKEEFLILS